MFDAIRRFGLNWWPWLTSVTVWCAFKFIPRQAITPAVWFHATGGPQPSDFKDFFVLAGGAGAGLLVVTLGLIGLSPAWSRLTVVPANEILREVALIPSTLFGGLILKYAFFVELLFLSSMTFGLTFLVPLPVATILGIAVGALFVLSLTSELWCAQTASNASLYWRAEYSPRGDIYVLRAGSGSSIHQPLRFPGMEAEQFLGNTKNGDTGKFYNVHRWYNFGNRSVLSIGSP